jgi:hypothetical protein
MRDGCVSVPKSSKVARQWDAAGGVIGGRGPAAAHGIFVLAKQGITISSGTFDSFDSSDAAYSTNGQYDPAKAKDDCLVGTTANTLEAAVVITNQARIKGWVAVASGSGWFASDTSAVGTAAWINEGNNGIQSGRFHCDLSLVIPDVQIPPRGGIPPLPGIAGGTNYTYVLSGSVGRYQMAVLTMSSS